MTLLLVLIVLVAGLAGYVRLAPSDTARWHIAPRGDESRDFKAGVLRVIDTGPDGLARLDAIASNSPRTTVLAGSVDEGMITYVTRTKVIGFPDYQRCSRMVTRCVSMGGCALAGQISG